MRVSNGVSYDADTNGIINSFNNNDFDANGAIGSGLTPVNKQ
jgi:hypothetical protein